MAGDITVAALTHFEGIRFKKCLHLQFPLIQKRGESDLAVLFINCGVLFPACYHGIRTRRLFFTLLFPRQHQMIKSFAGFDTSCRNSE